jgi:hypothetical protein
MKIILFLAIITAIFVAYKQMKAKKVKGSKAEIVPLRQNSYLSPLGIITVTLSEVKKVGEEIMFVCYLENEMSLGDFRFNYIILKPKKDDDDLNRKKAVVCYVHAGHTESKEPARFMDWGLVKVL